MSNYRGPRWSWPMILALRELRGSGRKLFLFLTAIIIGVASLVLTDSFSRTLNEAMDEQSRALLGADIVIKSRVRIPEAKIAAASARAAEMGEQVTFRSMAAFKDGERPVFALIRAVSPGIPYYGRFETVPERISREGAWLIAEESIFIQTGAEIGETVAIGGAEFQLRAALTGSPDEINPAYAIAPRVLIPLEYLEGTNLIRRGSSYQHSLFLKLADPAQAETIRESLREEFPEQDYEIETVRERRAVLGDIQDNVTALFALSGFASLLIGALGVGAALHFFVQRRVRDVVLLRCLGGPFPALMSSFLIQVVVTSFMAGVVGAGIGAGLHLYLAAGAAEALGVDLTPALEWKSVAMGIVVAVITGLVFSFPPLFQLRKVSPAAVLRDPTTELARSEWNVFVAAITVLIGGASFAVLYTESFRIAAAWTGGLAAALLLVLLASYGLSRFLRKLASLPALDGVPYPIRQGLRNLYRPGNQTAITLLALGLGSTLISLVTVAHHLVHQRTALALSEQRPNLLVFDIGAEEREEMRSFLAERSLTVYQEVPIVLMRITSVRGKKGTELLAEDGDEKLPRWTLRREFWTSYRSSEASNERVIEGTLAERYSGEGPVPVSLEKRLADRLRVGLGDPLSFNVHGVAVDAVVSSIREVFWERMERNSVIIFPPGALEEAPQFYFITTRTETPQEAASLQTDVMRKFPGVSVVDLRLAVRAIEGIIENISSAAFALAALSLLAGLAVLSVTIIASEEQQLFECSLLRTLGASRSQIRGVLISEAVLLAGVAVLCAVVLLPPLSGALARYVFKVDWSLPWVVLTILSFFIVSLAAMLAYWLARPVVSKSQVHAVRLEVA